MRDGSPGALVEVGGERWEGGDFGGCRAGRDGGWGRGFGRHREGGGSKSSYVTWVVCVVVA